MLILSQPLDEQFFADASATLRTTFAGNEGTYEVPPLKGSPPSAGTTLNHNLLWAPLVNPSEILHIMNFVVRRDALDNLHHHLLSTERPVLSTTHFVFSPCSMSARNTRLDS